MVIFIVWPVCSKNLYLPHPSQKPWVTVHMKLYVWVGLWNGNIFGCVSCRTQFLSWTWLDMLWTECELFFAILTKVKRIYSSFYHLNMCNQNHGLSSCTGSNFFRKCAAFFIRNSPVLLLNKKNVKDGIHKNIVPHRNIEKIHLISSWSRDFAITVNIVFHCLKGQRLGSKPPCCLCNKSVLNKSFKTPSSCGFCGCFKKR